MIFCGSFRQGYKGGSPGHTPSEWSAVCTVCTLAGQFTTW